MCCQRNLELGPKHFSKASYEAKTNLVLPPWVGSRLGKFCGPSRRDFPSTPLDMMKDDDRNKKEARTMSQWEKWTKEFLQEKMPNKETFSTPRVWGFHSKIFKLLCTSDCCVYIILLLQLFQLPAIWVFLGHEWVSFAWFQFPVFEAPQLMPSGAEVNWHSWTLPNCRILSKIQVIILSH